MSTDPERIRRLMALADGQLGGSECADLEASLSDDERRLIEEERRLVASARQALGGPGVPDALWACLKGRMQTPASSTLPSSHAQSRLPIWSPGALGPALAAGLLLAVGLTALLTALAPSGLEEGLASRADLSSSHLAESAAVGPERRATEAWLKEAGFGLSLERMEPLIGGAVLGGHKVRFLGATAVALGREQAADLLFDCCGESVQILLVRKDSEVARRLEALASSPSADQLNLSTRRIGNALAVTVSTHGGRGLLELLSPLTVG